MNTARSTKSGLLALAIASAMGSAIAADTYVFKVSAPGIKAATSSTPPPIVTSPSLVVHDAVGTPLSSLTFDPTYAGQTSPERTVLLSNTGNGVFHFGSPPLEIAAPFSVVGSTCGASIAAYSGSCSLTLVFSPQVTGNHSASLTVMSSVASASLALAGQGVALPPNWAVSGTPNTAFGSEFVGATATTPKTVTVLNSGGAGAFTVPPFTGDHVEDFTSSLECTTSTNCTVTVNFVPKAAGGRTATLVVGSTTLSFTGTGVAVPSDPSFANVKLLMHMDGSSGSTTFSDVKGNTITNSGTSSNSPSGAKYGAGSANMTGVGGLTTNTLASSVFSGAAWTVESWVYLPSTANGGHAANTLLHTKPYFTVAISMNRNGAGSTSIYVGNGSGWTAAPAIASSSPLPLDTWSHIALVKNAGVLSLYHNGVRVGTSSAIPSGFTGGATIGMLTDGSERLTGKLDELRVSDVARYTSNFTPPPAAFPNQ